jgi:hypothetical protein
MDRANPVDGTRARLLVAERDVEHRANGVMQA